MNRFEQKPAFWRALDRAVTVWAKRIFGYWIVIKKD